MAFIYLPENAKPGLAGCFRDVRALAAKYEVCNMYALQSPQICCDAQRHVAPLYIFFVGSKLLAARKVEQPPGLPTHG